MMLMEALPNGVKDQEVKNIDDIWIKNASIKDDYEFLEEQGDPYENSDIQLLNSYILDNFNKDSIVEFMEYKECVYEE